MGRKNGRKQKKKEHGFVSSKSLFKRYFLEMPFRVLVDLFKALGVNVIFAGIKIFYAVKYHSFWFGSLAVYYLALCAVRLFLVRRVQKKLGRTNDTEEWKGYRLTGIWLLLLNVTMVGCVIQMVRDEKGYEYPGVWIYVMAAYIFYCFVMSIVNAVKIRKHQSPILSATMALNLSTACMTLFNLQTALLLQFGGGSQFSYRMNMATGIGVCGFVIGMAVYMLIRAGKEMRQLTE